MSKVANYGLIILTVDKHWKSYPTGNMRESPESDCGVEKC